jgi:hypothetical protein
MTADVIPLIHPQRCAACSFGDGDVHLVAVGNPGGSVRNFLLHAACEAGFFAELPPGPRVRNPQRCAHCGRGGDMERATFLGVPAEGVAVHQACLVAFFAKVDASGWERY